MPIRAGFLEVLSMPFKKKTISLLLVLFSAYSFSSHADSYDFLGESCLVKSQDFVPRYFSGRARGREVDSFFDCIDNMIQFFLNHTTTANSKFYTKKELKHLMLYLGFHPSKAIGAAEAVIDMKKSLIEGHQNKISRSEIAKARKILRALQRRLKSILPDLPYIVRALNNKSVSRRQVLSSLNNLADDFYYLGESLSELSVDMNLSMLAKWPDNLQKLGFSKTGLKYWRPLVLLAAKWKKIFFEGPEHAIRNHHWPVLMTSFGHIVRLWTYYEKFIKNQTPWMGVANVQNMQYFMFLSLKLVEMVSERSVHKGLYLKDVEELGRHIWFAPFFSKPVFGMSLRSVQCFLIRRLAEGKPCEYGLTFSADKTMLSFQDKVYTIDTENKITMKSLSAEGEKFDSSDISVLFDYLNSWASMERMLRKEGNLRPIFGSPHKWAKRNIGITKGAYKRLVFQNFSKTEKDNTALLSHLNWHTYLTHFLVSAYSNKKVVLNQKEWNTLVREWTPVILSLYKDLSWQAFHKQAFDFFTHGDYLTANSNGDNTLQSIETVELVALALSSINMTALALNKLEKECSGAGENAFPAECIWSLFQDFSLNMFSGFPLLRKWFAEDSNYRKEYITAIRRRYPGEELSMGDLFEICTIMHYQENLIEFLDKDRSFVLSFDELLPLYEDMEMKLNFISPLLYTERRRLGFFTYLMQFAEIPVYDEKESVSAPLRFSNWLMNPGEWKNLQMDRKNIFTVLSLVHRNL